MDYYENLKAKNLELKFTLQKVKNHFHPKDLKSYSGKSFDLFQLEQPKSVLSSPVPQQQEIAPMVVYQQTDIIEQQQQQQQQKLIRSDELNSRYSYNHQIMHPPSRLQPGVGFGRLGGQNVNPHGLLPDLNITDASTATATAAVDVDETNSSSGIEPNNYIQRLYQQQQQHWFESSSNNRASAEARRRRMEEMRKGKRSMDSIKTRCR